MIVGFELGRDEGFGLDRNDGRKDDELLVGFVLGL